MKQSTHMEDHHYYLVRKAGSDQIQLVYIYGSFDWGNGVTEYDVCVHVFYDQKEFGLWGWNCGKSVMDYQQNVRYEEVLAEVTEEEVTSLLSVMREATAEAATWIDADWKTLNHYADTPYSCMYECGEYPYFTFWNNETHEQVLIWSKLLIHDYTTSDLISPDGERGLYYEITPSLFRLACNLHKEMSCKFMCRYRDFVYEKTGVSLPVEEYEPDEMEYEEIVALYREMAEKNPDVYLPELARIVGNLASLHEELQEYDQAEAEYNEAINICRNRKDYGTDANLQCLARNVGSLAGFHDTMQKYELSEDEYNEADSLYRGLAEKNPRRFLHDVATTVNNRAVLYDSLGRYSEAESGFRENVSIYKELAKTDSRFNVQVASGLRTLAHFYFQHEEYGPVIPTIDEAIGYNPTNPMLYESKGIFLLKFGYLDEAMNLYDQVWELDHDFFVHYTSDLYDGLKEQGLI